jgi:hypothetical protein
LNRFYAALGGYAVIGLLAWFTLSDEKIRLATLAVLALVAVKTILANVRMKQDARESRE